MPDDPALQLRAALEEAARLRAANAGLTRERDQAAASARTEAGGRIAAEESAIDSALAAAQEEKRGQERELAELQAEGKFTEAAALIGKMTDTSARIQSHQQRKEDLAGRRAQAEQRPEPRQEQQDPLAGLSERERAWVAEHPAYLTDAAYARKVAAAANYATETLGYSRDEDRYIKFVDEALNGRVEPAAPAPRVAAEPAAEPAAGDVRISVSAANPEPQEPAAMPANPADRPVRIEDEMVEQMFPQQRAVGNGGAGIRQVAAPPSRRIRDLSNQYAGGQDIIATPEELETARILMRDIMPEVAQEGDEAILRQYHVLYNSPSSRRKLRKWYGANA
jgi:hypothetical protein